MTQLRGLSPLASNYLLTSAPLSMSIALLFGVYIGAPDFWKLPSQAGVPSCKTFCYWPLLWALFDSGGVCSIAPNRVQTRGPYYGRML